VAQVRHLPSPADGERVETGPVQFGDDWPGLFIRGDHALYLASVLDNHLQSDGPYVLGEAAIKSLAASLNSVNACTPPKGDE